jgi:hypothetical protein
VGGQQLGVTAFPLDVPPEAHGRTVTNRLARGTSLERGVVSLRMRLEP